MTTRDGTITLNDFERMLALPANAERKLYLLNGEIIEAMPTPEHGLVASLIMAHLLAYLADQPIGRALIEVRLRLAGAEQFGLVPDLCVIRAERLAGLNWQAPLPFVPDLCIEIASPGQGAPLLHDKAAYYLANGGRMVWLVFPDVGTIEAITPGERISLTRADVISGGDVLPGFRADVAALLPLL